MDGKVLSLDEIKALAELPPRSFLCRLRSGIHAAPITSLAIVIKATASRRAALSSRRGVE